MGNFSVEDIFSLLIACIKHEMGSDIKTKPTHLTWMKWNLLMQGNDWWLKNNGVHQIRSKIFCMRWLFHASHGRSMEKAMTSNVIFLILPSHIFFLISTIIELYLSLIHCLPIGTRIILAYYNFREKKRKKILILSVGFGKAFFFSYAWHIIDWEVFFIL